MILCGAAMLSLIMADCAAPSRLRASRAQPALGIGFESVHDHAIDWADVARRFDDAAVSGFSVAVGRPEWLAFPWTSRQDAWASQVVSGADRIRTIIDTLAPERSRTVTLTVDVLSPARITADPDLAGVFAHGAVSTDFPSASALHDGDLGAEVVELCAEVAERYRPDRIALTELIGEAFFNGDDEDLFRRMTGATGFPRDAGMIVTHDPSVTAWQSAVITAVVERCAEAAAPFGTTVGMDARVNWEDPGQDRPDSGHLYAEILAIGAHLTLWAYTGLQDIDPARTADLAEAIRRRLTPEQLARTTISVGLWSEGREPMPPAHLALAFDGAARGTPEVLVTPLSLMRDEHWDVLTDRAGQR